VLDDAMCALVMKLELVSFRLIFFLVVVDLPGLVSAGWVVSTLFMVLG
jgi:hypothetical protein